MARTHRRTGKIFSRPSRRVPYRGRWSAIESMILTARSASTRYVPRRRFPAKLLSASPPGPRDTSSRRTKWRGPIRDTETVSVICSHRSYIGRRSLSRAISSHPAIMTRSRMYFFFVYANERSLFHYYLSRTRWSFFFFYYAALFENSFARHISFLHTYVLFFLFFSFLFSANTMLLFSSAESTPDKPNIFCSFVFYYYRNSIFMDIR